MANPDPPPYIDLLGEEEPQEDEDDEEEGDEDEDEEDSEEGVVDAVDEDYARYLSSLVSSSYRVSQNGAEIADESASGNEVDESYARYLSSLESSRVSQSVDGNAGETAQRNGPEEGGEKRRRIGGCELDGGGGGAESSQGSEWSRSEIDGLFCPICMEAWTDDGDHHICCLPCGHVYGMSCIKKWLQQRKSSGKCPQCNKKCTLKDVRKLFASRVVSVGEESQKSLEAKCASLETKCASLQTKCASLENKGAGWCKKEAEWLKREFELQHKVQQLTERTTYLEHLLGDMQSRTSGLVHASGVFEGRFISGKNFGSKLYGQASSCSFILEKELQVDGARLFDVDACNQILLISRRLGGIGGTHVLTKMSLIPPYDRDDILLPRGGRVIRDLRISPSNSNLALFACLGKKLSVLSMESNNVILAYDLPAAAWTCSWDVNNSHYIYAGLQNGSLLVFDMRQTARPVESLSGLTNNPVHTVHTLLHSSALPSGVRPVLSASSIGLCLWNFGSAEEGPILVPETKNQGICISLAYCPSSDDIVASYRPKVEMPDETAFSQPPLTPSHTIGQGTVGSHVHLNREGSCCLRKLGSSCTNVCDIGLPKTAIIDIENHGRLFASEDKLSSELIIEELPSFTTFQRLKLHGSPVRDLKYTPALRQGQLSCLSGDTLQLFSTKFS